MNKLLLINTSANTTSPGRIAEEIGHAAIARGYDSYFAYGRTGRESKSKLIRIGTDWDFKIHGIESMLWDNHGFGSRVATRKFIEDVESIRPDVVNLHNIHGYYLNVDILFGYLAEKDIPIVWTLHDCWPFTGHCAYFDRYQCEKWKAGCYHCPNSKGYPKSLLLDRSKSNYLRKKEIFNKPKNIILVAVCDWMANNLMTSFLSNYPIVTIYNGVDIDVFRPRFSNEDECKAFNQKLGVQPDVKIILGVASTWDGRKGLDDFVKLRSMFDKERYAIILVGLNDKQIAALPDGIIGIKRTESVDRLAELYSLADVFVNPTYVDNFPTTNIEALACGTPVVTYRTGGSPEAVDERTGGVVNQGDVSILCEAVEYFANRKGEFSHACRERALKNFNKQDRFDDYVRLFDRLINHKQLCIKEDSNPHCVSM